jgi:hypothetical protein
MSLTPLKAPASTEGPNIFQAIMPGATLKLAVGAAHAESAAVGSALIRVLSTTDCHIVIGAAPVATADDMLVLANQPEYFHCNPADLVSVIRDSADGSLYITGAL